MKDEIIIKDYREKIKSGQYTKIPNDFIDKYAKLFLDSEERYAAVIDLMRQCYKEGVEDGKSALYDSMING